MKISKKGETIVSIIFVVIIVSIIAISLLKIVEYDNELNLQYDKTNYISLLEKNTNTLIKGVDTSKLKEKEVFYLFKSGSSISALSGTLNEDYKFVNYLGENVSSGSYDGSIYTRFCLVEKDSTEGQMIKCSIKEMIRK